MITLQIKWTLNSFGDLSQHYVALVLVNVAHRISMSASYNPASNKSNFKEELKWRLFPSGFSLYAESLFYLGEKT